MHRTIGYISKRFAHIRPGEGQKVLLTFSFFFLVITAYYIIKPVSRSLILNELGSQMVPYADLICVVLMGPIVTGFSRLVDRVAKPRLIALAFWTVAGAMVVFWQLLQWNHPLVSGAFYIWVSIFSVLVVTLFWLVANDLFRARDAKRLFGFIGSGGSLGAIAGSSIAAVGAQVIGTKNLPLCSAALLLVCWWLVQRLWAFAPAQVRTDDHSLATPRHDTFLSEPKRFAKLLLQSRYLLLLVALVCIAKIVSKFVYYQFNPFIETTFPSLDAKTTFTSVFYANINVVVFFIQFFLTSWTLRRWGLLTALLVLPLGLLFGGLALLALPLFWLAGGLELYDKSLNYSLNNTSKEVLYLPIDRSIRYKVKPFIDMVVFRFGGGVSAVAGIVLLNQLQLPAWWLGVLMLPLLMGWLLIAVLLRREYVTRIRTLLQARSASKPPTAEPVERFGAGVADGSDVVTMGPLLAFRSPAQKLSLAARLCGAHSESAPGKSLLGALKDYEAAPERAGGLTGLEVTRLKHIIQDQSSHIPLRRQAIRLMARQSDQDAVDYFCGMLIVEGEAALRHEVARELMRVRVSQRGLQFPTAQIRRQIDREAAFYQRIARVSSVYRQHHRGPLTSDDPVVAMLRVLLEESVEQVFRLLSLLYRPEDIHLVYEQMRAPDTHVRADAIELLDNLVDPTLRGTLLPIFDEDRFLGVLDEPIDVPHEPALAYRFVQEAIWDHNRWLSVTTLCAMGRLQLTTFRQELERASRHTEGVVATAAEVALLLAATLP